MIVQDTLITSAKHFPDKTALVCSEQRHTYAELFEMSCRMAGVLRTLGLRRQGRVVIFCENSVESVVSVFGILIAGGIFVMLNPAAKSKKLAFILNDSGACILIAQIAKSSVVREAVGESSGLRHLIWVGEPQVPILTHHSQATSHQWANVISESTASPDPIGIIDVDLAGIIYTSGSTGEPKGVMSAHYNMVASARSIAKYLENSPEDIILSTLALSHGYGLYQVLTTFLVGGRLILEPSFAFPYKVLQRISEDGVTGLPIVPIIATILLNLKDFSRFDLGSLRYITSAAAALPVSHIRRLREHLPHVKIYSMYGLTECTRVCYLPPAEIGRRPASVGFPMPNCEAYVVNEEGRKLGSNQVGELVVRGSNVNQGYWAKPEETERQFRSGKSRGDVLLYTGDLFKQDEEGFLYFVARKDDLIKTRGERISPKEIEDVICDIRGVAQAAVVGVPDEIFGQAIKAFVVLSADSRVKKTDILCSCKKNIEPFMVPKFIELRDFLPVTSNGKINKKLLK